MEVPMPTTRQLLEAMGEEGLAEHFESLDISAPDFVTLTLIKIKLILPQPQFPTFRLLSFIESYITFMKEHNFVLHPSLATLGQMTEMACPSIVDTEPSRGIGLEANKENCGSRERPKQKGRELSNLLTESNHEDASCIVKQSLDFGDSDDSVKDTTFSPKRHGGKSGSDSSDSSLECVKEKKGKVKKPMSRRVLSAESECLSSDDGSNSVAQGKRSSGEKNAINEDSDDSMCSDSEAQPLVNSAVLGEKRRNARAADAAVDNLVLKKFFKERPMCRAVLVSYKKGKKLNEDDRRTLCKAVVSWLLTATDYRPTQWHYNILTEKILSLFPTEKSSMWFLPPRSEGQKQKCSKGKLPDKVRNSKAKLRRKGLLVQVKRGKKENDNEENNNSVAVPFDVQERASKAWLVRNNHPFHDVQKHWATCRAPRMKELFLNSQMTVAQYNKDWNGILKLPESYQLVLDDFEALPAVFPAKYGGLRVQQGDITQHWTDFRAKIVQILPLCGLSKKELDEFQARLDSALNENTKDYLILGLLPSICKLKCSVKIGKKVQKPTALESQKAFMMCVSGPGEFELKKRERRERYAALKAPVQPYLAVISAEATSVSASYVIVDDIIWKPGSVVQALEICLKTHFSLNCEYAPEAKHLWLLIQQAVFGITLEEDVHFSSVTDLLGKLDSL